MHHRAFAPLAVVTVWLLAVAVRRLRTVAAPHGGPSALAVGGLTFIPWLPHVDEAAHTGTPWGGLVSPVSSTVEAVKSFGGNTHAASVGAAADGAARLLFARAHRCVAHRRGPDPGPASALEVGLGFAALGLGPSRGCVTETTFEGRYRRLANVPRPLGRVCVRSRTRGSCGAR